MSGIIIDRDDLGSIIAALTMVASSGAAELQAQPPDIERVATNLAGLYDLIARLLKHDGNPEAAMFAHNARECTRMVAALELARIAGQSAQLEITLAEPR